MKNTAEKKEHKASSHICEETARSPPRLLEKYAANRQTLNLLEGVRHDEHTVILTHSWDTSQDSDPTSYQQIYR